MIYENVELHNVAALQTFNSSKRLQRIPEEVRGNLNENAQMRVLQPDNCEIRFVSVSEDCQVTLSSEGETDVTLFYGTFDSRERYTVGKKPKTIRINQQLRLQKLENRWWKDQPFAPNVVRLILGGRRRDPLILHDIIGKDIRPPHPEEVPGIRYLAYGTSITHGFDCEGPHLSYVAQTAWHLGADLINLGVAGACLCEKAFADYIADRDDWNIASLALSVNMHEFPLAEFRSRLEYMINRVAGPDQKRAIACITLFPYFRDYGISDPGAAYGATSEEYRQTLRDIVTQYPHSNVYLVEGNKLLTNIGGLTADLIHPSDNAMIEIGKNLAGELQNLLKK